MCPNDCKNADRLKICFMAGPDRNASILSMYQVPPRKRYTRVPGTSRYEAYWCMLQLFLFVRTYVSYVYTYAVLSADSRAYVFCALSWLPWSRVAALIADCWLYIRIYYMILYYTFVRIRTRGKGAVAAAAVVDVVADSSSYHTYQVSIYYELPVWFVHRTTAVLQLLFMLHIARINISWYEVMDWKLQIRLGCGVESVGSREHAMNTYGIVLPGIRTWKSSSTLS